MKRVIPMLLIMIFLGGLAVVPPILTVMNNNVDPINYAIPSQNTDLTVRVAIYDEDNTTVPTTGYNPNHEGFSNHLSEIQTLLEGAGHEVTLLTTEDIENHELLLADYDVFLLVNNLPKDSISNLVKEFWLGGGGLMTFDKAFAYLSYKSIIWPDLGLDGYGILWGNQSADVMNVTARHPTMKDYHVNETVSERVSDWTIISQDVLDGSDVWYTITPLLANITEPDFLYGFAMDSRYEGGRVVHLPGDGVSIPTALESIIVDSVEWLMPRPKGRIAFDLTHQPRIGIDPWDWPHITTYSSVHNFDYFRDLAANHTYTFDKLYPSTTGNITADRLAPYDVLVMAWPDINYTSAEGAIIEAWVDGGGSLLVLGDRTGLGWPNNYGDTNLNMVLQNFDMSLGTTDIPTDATMTPESHVTLESCTGLSIGYRNYLVVLGNATEIWMDGSDCVVAGEEFGQGRAILSSDMNIFDNGYIREGSNTRYALNVLNWLTAADAEILVYDDYLGWNAPVCVALRDLGFSYQLFSDHTYLQDFIDSKEWELLIWNSVFLSTELLRLDELYAFVDDGGRLLMTYWNFDDVSTHPLWSKLGVEYASTLSGEPSMYVWDTTHSIFTEPNDHSMYNYTSTGSFFDDGDAVTVRAGYIALAGTTADVQDGKAAIVVSPDKQTLVNAFLIDNFGSDEDDSTYMDSVELWENEITFMLTPVSGLPFNLDPMTLLIIGGAVLGLIIILALVMRRRGGGSKPKPRKKKKK
ncbi:MAG: hypothetical protein RTV31_10215 [Candidatus Thorarchaeota archaeon]